MSEALESLTPAGWGHVVSGMCTGLALSFLVFAFAIGALPDPGDSDGISLGFSASMAMGFFAPLLIAAVGRARSKLASWPSRAFLFGLSMSSIVFLVQVLALWLYVMWRGLQMMEI